MGFDLLICDLVRPTRAMPLSNIARKLIYERDGGRCCITGTPFKSYLDDDLEYVQIVSPLVFTDLELAEEVRMTLLQF